MASRKRLAEAWEKFEPCISESVPEETRRLIKFAFYSGAGAYEKATIARTDRAPGEGIDFSLLTGEILDYLESGEWTPVEDGG